jgi:hypothetical protein
LGVFQDLCGETDRGSFNKVAGLLAGSEQRSQLSAQEFVPLAARVEE